MHRVTAQAASQREARRHRRRAELVRFIREGWHEAFRLHGGAPHVHLMELVCGLHRRARRCRVGESLQIWEPHHAAVRVRSTAAALFYSLQRRLRNGKGFRGGHRTAVAYAALHGAAGVSLFSTRYLSKLALLLGARFPSGGSPRRVLRGQLARRAGVFDAGHRLFCRAFAFLARVL